MGSDVDDRAMSPHDPELVRAILDAIPATLAAIARTHPGERLTGYALGTDDDLMSVLQVAITTAEFDFCLVDWPYEDRTRHLDEVHARLRASYDAATVDQTFAEHVQRSFASLVEALAVARAEGQFDEDVFLDVASFDPDPHRDAMEEAAIVRLNSPLVVRRWREAHLRGAEESLAAHRASGDDAYWVQDAIVRLEARARNCGPCSATGSPATNDARLVPGVARSTRPRQQEPRWPTTFAAGHRTVLPHHLEQRACHLVERVDELDLVIDVAERRAHLEAGPDLIRAPHRGLHPHPVMTAALHRALRAVQRDAHERTTTLSRCVRVLFGNLSDHRTHLPTQCDYLTIDSQCHVQALRAVQARTARVRSTPAVARAASQGSRSDRHGATRRRAETRSVEHDEHGEYRRP
jgi:hypothetical protein